MSCRCSACPPGRDALTGLPWRCTASSNDNDGHRLAPSHRDRDVLDADRNRVAPDDAFVKHLDLGAFHESEFDQATFELDRGKRGTGSVGGKVMDHPGIAALGQAQGNLRGRIGLLDGGHGLYFQPRTRRSSAARRNTLTLEEL